MTDIKLLPNERLDQINENLSLIQDKNGLTFGTDAYLLASFVKNRAGVGADFGSGTGVASLLCLSKNKFSFVYAFEVQDKFARLTERNAVLNGFCEKSKVYCKDVRDITPDDTNGWIDTVISNPPYLKADEGFANKTDEMNIARREMNGTIYDFCASASKILKHGGIFYTVYRPDRLAEMIHALKCNTLEPKRIVTVHPDTNTPASLVLIESKKGAAPSLKFAKPLFIYKDGTRTYTEDMDRVYEETSLDFLF
ncbi:MAG: methyltransferase [Clostridia bacterium]|nr:methyltransferase [Clostridia bacterium]